MRTAEDIVGCIRAKRDDTFELSDSEAALMINLFASIAVTKAEAATPRPSNENTSAAQYDRSQEALAHILGVG